MTNKQKIIWAAGFIDGEGCIYVAKAKNKSMKQRIRYDLRVSISQVDIESLKIMKNIFGGCLYKRPKRKINEWNVTSFEAINLLEKIYPFLIVKRKEAHVGLKFKSLMSNKLGHRISNRDYKKKEIIYKKLQKIKKEKYKDRWE